MKIKTLIFALVCLLSAAATAQEHLTFKGIPITGSMDSFCSKLKEKGFEQLFDEGNIRVFSGKFTGRTATVGVGASADGKGVFAVSVLFNEESDWEFLTNTYHYYKEIYTRKYGKPHTVKEDKPGEYDSNVSLMYKLSEGKLTYASTWEIPGGTIDIQINKVDSPMHGQVTIHYRDTHNSEMKMQKDMEEI